MRCKSCDRCGKDVHPLDDVRYLETLFEPAHIDRTSTCLPRHILCSTTRREVLDCLPFTRVSRTLKGATHICDGTCDKEHSFKEMYEAAYVRLQTTPLFILGAIN